MKSSFKMIIYDVIWKPQQIRESRITSLCHELQSQIITEQIDNFLALAESQRLQAITLIKVS